jgi:hypothetical protein
MEQQALCDSAENREGRLAKRKLEKQCTIVVNRDAARYLTRRALSFAHGGNRNG